ncbi:MAG: DNA-3-methyladenine glycosylase I [Gammaproteobacteria bacterium]|jgi:3-methyladenine DNA glycosylase Tag|nr:DNA-3-methyladenine glycosylase I [Gammaproteobacteria bacterium]MBT4078944.1 DNA-3-methyladenine glycosylase I [Gammaproteobacteria bacterium]MBT4448589.1 DNA-3-methyladenine glycosylase I [Gammaproteobacteria bacterium]MBT6701862.1 DNA-3-methyladenine glycosylase I [Gammaproteobacteria bacterium]
MDSFKIIIERAEKRKGGKKALLALLPQSINAEELRAKPDSFFLEEMTRSIFQSGFVWRVINNKWPTFRQAFFDFDIGKLMRLSSDDWDNYMQDTRIVRHRQKIQAVRHNLWFVNETAGFNGDFGQFLLDWPKSDLVGLFRFLKSKGSRLGGNTGQYFLQHVGVDSFALTGDVVLCLKLSGLDINDRPSSQKDLKLIQQAFNGWHEETGFDYYRLSMIMAYSVGENKIHADESFKPDH